MAHSTHLARFFEATSSNPWEHTCAVGSRYGPTHSDARTSALGAPHPSKVAGVALSVRLHCTHRRRTHTPPVNAIVFCTPDIPLCCVLDRGRRGKARCGVPSPDPVPRCGHFNVLAEDPGGLWQLPLAPPPFPPPWPVAKLRTRPAPHPPPTHALPGQTADWKAGARG